MKEHLYVSVHPHKGDHQECLAGLLDQANALEPAHNKLYQNANFHSDHSDQYI